MSQKETLTIDGIPVEINGEKNLLELIRKAGIEMPTFCYYSELSIYGGCRMCMVENGKGIEAACSTPPRAGMEIRTNTERLRKHRKMILELLLSNHCRDCTTCSYSGKCRLQDLARRFNIQGVRFPNTAPTPISTHPRPALHAIRASAYSAGIVCACAMKYSTWGRSILLVAVLKCPSAQRLACRWQNPPALGVGNVLPSAPQARLL